MTPPSKNQFNPLDMISAIFGCNLTAFIASIAIATGAVVSIAMGFKLTYLLLTTIGN